MPKSSADMAQLGRMGAFALHSRHDSRETSAPGRAAFLSRFEREVDPTGELDPRERARRAEHAKRLHMARLAYQSARTRAANKKKQTTEDESVAGGKDCPSGGVDRVPDDQQHQSS